MIGAPAQAVSPSQAGRFGPYVIAIAVFLFFAIAFLLLRTRQYLAVDGALRCLEVYHRQALFFHGNNHLLYPANTYVWSRALNALGFQAHTPFEFIALTQALNALAAAGCLAVIYVLVWIATSSPNISLVATCAYGFSRALMLHGTSSAEPVTGLFFSALGMLIVVEALRRNRNWLLALAGLSLALALACYESMVLISPLAFLFCLGWPTVEGTVASTKMRGVRVAVLASGGFVAVCAIFGWAYWTSGERSIANMIQRFLQPGERSEVYGYFSISKLVNAPFGLIWGLWPALPRDYAGVRSLLRENHNIFWITCILVALGWLCRICWLFASPVIRKWHSIGRFQRHLVLVLGIILLLLIVPLLYWSPLYDKLWLQPMGVIIVLLAVLYRIGFTSARPRNTIILIVASIALAACLNLGWAIPARRNPTQGIKESLIVADVVRSNDFIVLNFDDISTLYSAFWGSTENSLLLPASRPELASSRLARAIKEAQEEGGHVYFLSVLDMPEQAWTAFLGDRVGIPYHSFDLYRLRSTVIRSFESNGQTVTLRRLR